MPPTTIADVSAKLDDMHDTLERLAKILEGHNSGTGPRQPGIVERVERVERIVAAVTALFLGTAGVIAGAWGLVWWGPHK